MLISIITINYHSRDYLQNMIRSLHTHCISIAPAYLTFELIIVNNEEIDLLLDDDLPIKPWIVNMHQNLGFAKANNIGVRHSSGDILLFLNPDVTVPNDSLLSMIHYSIDHPNVGIIGPKIILAKENRPQPWTCGAKTNLASILFRNTIAKPWNKNHTTAVDWVSGTALLIKKNDFTAIDGFDEQFFMYFEDQDLCLRIKTLGKQNFFFPTAQIIHHDGKSWPTRTDQKHYFYQSQDYFFQKHHSLPIANIVKLLRLPFSLLQEW